MTKADATTLHNLNLRSAPFAVYGGGAKLDETATVQSAFATVRDFATDNPRTEWTIQDKEGAPVLSGKGI